MREYELIYIIQPDASDDRIAEIHARIDGEIACIVPDLICLVDTDRGEPITTELVRYGFRVTVLGFPAPPLWTTQQGLAVAGPQAFGYDLDYTPLEV